MLNVQKVRLRFIFIRVLYLYRLFQKANGEAVFKNISSAKPPRMAVVVCSNDVFCSTKNS